VTGKAILAGAALLAAACSAQAEAPGAVTATISYQAEIVPLLESNCATCHLTGEEAGGMSLVGDAAIGFLVGTPSQEAPALIRVVAGNPDKSYLVMKLEGTYISHGGSGAQMPFGAPPLAPEQIAKVRQWIAEGAKP
jgi:mono/diheme cytochrome c family protein